MNNTIIEAENLKGMKDLLPSLKEKVKVIYIDPPYNKGNYYTYKDKQKREDWLDFMKERLFLARDFLTKDGCIFISIDISQSHYLKVLCDEVFKEKNFVGEIINKKRGACNNTKYLNVQHESILLYSKKKDLFEMNKVPVTDYGKSKLKSFKDKYFKERGFFQVNSLVTRKGFNELPFEYPKGNLIYPKLSNGEKAGWRWKHEKIKVGIENEFVILKNNTLYNKIYEKVDGNNQPRKAGQPFNSLIQFNNKNGTRDLSLLFGSTDIFDYPKPVALIKHLLSMVKDNNYLVLDFFAGSGTTGQAVLELNLEDNGNRQFILIQSKESINFKKEKSLNFCKENQLKPVISSLTTERILRVMKKIKQDKNNKRKLLSKLVVR